MKPTDQTVFGAGGDCLAASIASIMEMPLTDLPDTGHRGYQEALARALAPRGVIYVEVPVGPLVRLSTDDPPLAERMLGWQPLFYVMENARPWCVLCGPSPRGAWDHCVVGTTNGYLWEVAHDPHPDRTGIVTLTHIGLFVCANPAADR